VEFAGIFSTIAPEWLVEVQDSYKEDKLAKNVFHKLEEVDEHMDEWKTEGGILTRESVCW
jgi:hypothetical protein